jgi:2,3-bisphosphoglycerate-independent phosphoglycerate mutase
MLKPPKPVVLLILDGFGYTEETQHNAIAQANTPCWDNLLKENPSTLLDCSGDVVGLPEGQMGNSEVGHMHIGSGRFVPQDLSRINIAIKDGSFYSNPVLCKAIDKALEKDKALHILGLLSSGGVHSHIEQIEAMIELAAKRGLTKIYIHAILDGRDVPPKSAEKSIEQLEAKLKSLNVGRIVSIIGRFYAMDRDSRWDRVEVAYNLIVKGASPHQAASALQALQNAYQRDETDEFVAATAILDANDQPVQLDADDSFVFMNFRADRAREISRAITEAEFREFDRGEVNYIGCFTTLTEYHQAFSFPVAYASLEVKNGLGETLSKLGLTQLRLAETEKYAHVTFFLNGGRDDPFPGEERIMVPSPRVKTYDLQPEMNAEKVTNHLVDAIKGQQYDVIICNYANCDMVGHTGKWQQAIVAVEAIDAALQRIVEALETVEGKMLVTADHGNIEQMLDMNSGQPNTAHSTNQVPLVFVAGDRPLSAGGSLSDLAPTILEILGVQQPVEMTGKSLLEST